MEIRSHRRRLIFPALIALLAALRCGAATAAPGEPAPLTMKLVPTTIEMGAFYGGVPITVEGDAPPGSMVMVVLRGPARDEVFNKKGRLGPIWLNTDKVHVTGAPSLFLRFSSVDVHSILDRRHIDRYQLDEVSIVERMHVRTSRGEPDAAYRELIQDSYIDLKKKNGTYRRIATRVQVTKADGGEHYTLLFHWPKTAPPGSYQVEVYACRDNHVIARANTELRLVQVGFPAFTARLAHEHPGGTAYCR